MFTGSLLNAAVTDIITSVLSIEEFSADDCDYLQDVLSHVLESGTEYFKSDDPKHNAQVRRDLTANVFPSMLLIGVDFYN